MEIAFWDLFALLRVWCSRNIAVHSVPAESAAESFTLPRDLKLSRAMSSSQASGLFFSFFRYQTNSSIKPQSKPKLSGKERATRINQKQMLLINRWGFIWFWLTVIWEASNLADISCQKLIKLWLMTTDKIIMNALCQEKYYHYPSLETLSWPKYKDFISSTPLTLHHLEK